MSFTQQLLQFLSQPPESVVFHALTMLALQATIGLSLWQLRRYPNDAFARRLTWATGAILILRIVAVLVMIMTDDGTGYTATLAPLERAIDTLTAVLLVWALTHHPPNLPRISEILLLVMALLVGFMYTLMAQDWVAQVNAGAITDGFANSQQATM
jgi:hypothetical protein